ncbi:hypothetical protein N7478_001840 [Penicillium angulare]|uniref:uncharacterized protein n=1 Tax=Penicillium angulare TaxID=116970 RepID=UPI002540DFFF|nr:uncharacterized protein N7478_001840 [Penicillium angulare]KAJ5288810.1 hypothetical protein N7478_001840 [Penicillium angulare]
MVCLLRWVLCGGFVISLVDTIFAARPQAIGIDFGPEMITVAHAYSSDNVTLPACIKPELGDPFNIYLFLLRLESWSDGTLDALYGRKNEGTSGISNAVVKLFARLVSSLTCCSHDTANLSWVRQCVCSAWHGITARLRSVKRSELEEFTLDDVKDAFVDILTRLQEEARTKHNIDMQSAVIALPDFFNQTLVDLFLEASRKVGIMPLVEPMSRMAASTYSSNGTPREADGKYVIMDLGQYYLDLRSLNVSPRPMARNGRLPMDPWGSAGLDRDITRSAIERSEILQTWLLLGGSKAALQEEVRKARVLIRENIDREVLGAEDHQDHHHNEYPLHLKDPDATAVLSWADVEAAEMRYIQSIAQNVHNYLVAANNPTGDIRDDMAPTKIDKAFILTSGFDGSLIKQSLEHALGDVEIIGGRLRDSYLAAEGAAQVGLLYQQAWDQRHRLLWKKDEL